MTGPSLTVVIPTFNRWGTLTRCLDALGAQTTDDFEVVVVDDGSSEPAPAGLDRRPYPLRVAVQPNRGPAAARNLGLSLARGAATLFVNDDTILAPDAVARHADHHRRGVPVAVLGTFDLLAPFADEPLGRLLAASTVLFQYGCLRDGDRPDYNFAYTANLSVPTDLARTEGFDERFTGPAGEDIDFGYRLQQRGIPLVFDAGARAGHDHTMTAASLPRTFFTRGFGSVTFVEKWRHHLPPARATLDAMTHAASSPAALESAVRASAARLDALLSEGPGRAAFAELANLSNLASLRGAIANPAWNALRAA